MSVLATEASLPDRVALGAGAVGLGRPLEHRALVLGGGRTAEERGTPLLGAQLREHDGPKANETLACHLASVSEAC